MPQGKGTTTPARAGPSHPPLTLSTTTLTFKGSYQHGELTGGGSVGSARRAAAFTGRVREERAGETAESVRRFLRPSRSWRRTPWRPTRCGAHGGPSDVDGRPPRRGGRDDLRPQHGAVPHAGPHRGREELVLRRQPSEKRRSAGTRSDRVRLGMERSKQRDRSYRSAGGNHGAGFDEPSGGIIARGGWLPDLLKKRGVADAVVIGDYIMLPDEGGTPNLIDHERNHVGQGRLLGPLYLPATRRPRTH